MPGTETYDEKPEQIYEIPWTVIPRPGKDERRGKQQQRNRDDKYESLPRMTAGRVFHNEGQD